MSDEQGRPDSQKSRQELLDEIYLLRDVAGERDQRAQALHAQVVVLVETQAALTEARSTLAVMLASRSWRITAPLRAVTQWLAQRGPTGRHTQATTADSRSTDSDSQAALVGLPRPVAANAHPSQPAVSSSTTRQDGTAYLFVDITELALRQGKTGVQRVTREILRALLATSPAGYQVCPVVAETGQPYRLLRGFDADRLRQGALPDLGVAVAPRPGDVFLGLDHAMQAVVEHADALAEMHKLGVRLWFVCNDTLPLSRPDWFPPGVHESFKAWFETIARVGDGIACISQATEADVRHWLDVLQVPREQPLTLGHFHLGSDIVPGAAGFDRGLKQPTTARHPRGSGDPVTSNYSTAKTLDSHFRGNDDSNLMVPAITPEQQAALEQLRSMPSFLMVGTLEPRKGHAQALEAFNLLWARGEDIALVMVGLPGWMTEVTQRRIRHHDEFGKRLFWFMDANDALLDQLYRSCSALLAPSEGEGFGLPLVEAACHGLPILCRDLPVFREIAGEHAAYFSGFEPESIAHAVCDWQDANQRGVAPAPGDIRDVTWAESAQQLDELVLGQKEAQRLQ